MLRTYFNSILYPHEILILPLGSFVVGIYLYFGLKLDFIPEIVMWLVTALAVLAAVSATLFYIALGFKYVFKNKSPAYNVDWIKIRKFTRIISSLIVVLIIYENLQYAITYISTIDQDAALLYYESMVFNKQTIYSYLEQFISPWVTDWFSLSYISFFFYLPILGGYFYFADKLEEWSNLVLTITIALFSGYIFYIIFPAVGPGVYLQHEFTKTLDGQYISQAASAFVNTQGYARGTFPSLHIACSSIYLFFAYKNSRLLFLIFLPFIVSLWISTVFLRHHYLIDIFAGFCLAVICIFVGNYFYRKWYEKSER